MRLSKTYKLCLSAVFLALGYVLPFVTGQIPAIGKALSPMHLPVLLCGFICGAPWGAVIGAILPFLRSLTLGVPSLPLAISMAMELATYGALAGIFYKIFPKKIGFFYLSLVLSMLGGRFVWALGRLMIAQFFNVPFTFEIFLASGFTSAVPGIILQLVLVPILFYTLKKLKLIKEKKPSEPTEKTEAPLQTTTK